MSVYSQEHADAATAHTIARGAHESVDRISLFHSAVFGVARAAEGDVVARKQLYTASFIVTLYTRDIHLQRCFLDSERLDLCLRSFKIVFSCFLDFGDGLHPLLEVGHGQLVCCILSAGT